MDTIPAVQGKDEDILCNDFCKRDGQGRPQLINT